jgi:Fic family protein
MTFIHELREWPQFRWEPSSLATPLSRVHYLQGRLTGRMESLGFQVREESALRTLTEEVVKSSAIEGEKLDADQVRSSIARRLSMDVAGIVPVDRNVEGIVEMMIDATQNCAQPLTEERLFGWHAALFPTGRSGMRKIIVGDWRDDANGPMQVVSGPIGRETVHYTAPAAEKLPNEMRAFLQWFESSKTTDPVLDAAIAHLWFISIHPFDDGNGRIARAISDLALARFEHSTQRFYSMSSQIRSEQNDYYKILEVTQKGNLDITRWLGWFLACLDGALNKAEETLGGVMAKAHLWDRINDIPINERQRKMLNRLMDGFDGKLTLSRWASMTHVSKATSGRDLDDLVNKGILVLVGAGRGTSYELAEIQSRKVYLTDS